MKSTKTKSGGSGGGGAQEFLIWHGEKIVVGIVAVVALYFALQGLSYLGTKTLSWQPSALEEDANSAETGIRNSTRTAEDEGIELFDHAKFAEQIKAPISAAPYSNPVLWNPGSFSASQRTGTQTRE
jgi:hypothetical protein